jgi:hypothetical protein
MASMEEEEDVSGVPVVLVEELQAARSKRVPHAGASSTAFFMRKGLKRRSKNERAYDARREREESSDLPLRSDSGVQWHPDVPVGKP